MATVSYTSLIQRVRDLLPLEEWETTGTAADASTTSITVPDGTLWAPGDVGEFQDNGERVLVRSVSGNTLTVKRAHQGTTSQAHSNAVLVKNPVFSYRLIDQSLRAVVQDLWPYAWKTTTVQITPSPTTVWYDVGSTPVADIVKATQRYGPSGERIGTFGARGSGKPIVLAKNLDTGLVPSGTGLRFPGGFFSDSYQVKVVFRTYITGSSDVPDDYELPVGSVCVQGALARLLDARAVDRTLPPRIEESAGVSEGGMARLAAYHRQLYLDGLQMLRLRMMQLWPPSGKVTR